MRRKDKKGVYILKNNNNSFERYFLVGLKKILSDVNVLPIYRFTFFPIGDYVVKRIFQQNYRLGSRVCYGKWKNRIKNGDTVIIFDNVYSLEILQEIKRKCPDSRIILWLWNIAEYEKNSVYSDIVEFWSFDQKECALYGYHKNIQFHVGLVTKERIYKSEYDFIFVGRDKGRQKVLRKLADKLDRIGLSYRIYIMKAEERLDRRFIYVSHSIPYRKYIKLLNKGKVIIDIAKENQSGETLRKLEARILGKKILTNNLSYNNVSTSERDNIFILELEDIHKLPEFVNRGNSLRQKDMTPIVVQWFENFFMG